MSNKEGSEKVSKRLDQHIRQARHGIEYYIALFLLFFAIPLYVLLQFFYAYEGGWSLYDLFFVLALLAIAAYGLYREFVSKTTLPVWFIVLGVISGIVVIVLQFIIG